MRPASEINSALDLAQSELDRMIENINDKERPDEIAIENLELLCDVLAWVMGAHWTELTDGSNPWLAAYLLDDPPKLDNTPPEVN